MQWAVKRLVEAVGIGGALLICRKYGGRELDVPKSNAGRDKMALSIGQDLADAMVKAFGGQRMRIPAEHLALLDARNAAIWKARADGMSTSKIAPLFGLTRPGVEAVLAKLKDRPDLQVFAGVDGGGASTESRASGRRPASQKDLFES